MKPSPWQTNRRTRSRRRAAYRLSVLCRKAADSRGRSQNPGKPKFSGGSSQLKNQHWRCSSSPGAELKLILRQMPERPIRNLQHAAAPGLHSIVAPAPRQQQLTLDVSDVFLHVNTFGRTEPEPAETGPPPPAAAARAFARSAGSSTVSSSPASRATARSMVFSNWRTLPGQS